MKKFDEKEIPKDYPRPQMVRENFENLNGVWEYAIRDDNNIPMYYDGMIHVPFAPESRLSKVEKKILPGLCIWYHRKLWMEEEEIDGRILLHFGGVDQEAWVYINGFLAARHVGGYHPFTVDITPYLSADNDIVVKVKDYTEFGRFLYGKQHIENGIGYKMAQSGIWQTVWLERVPEYYMKDIMMKPVFDKGMVRLRVNAKGNHMCTAIIGKQEIIFPSNVNVEIKLDKVIPWTPERPFLYSVIFEMEEDKARGYFGMRKFSVEKDKKGNKTFMLNNKPYDCKIFKDTGYYSDGIYTAPDDAEMVKSILAAKKKGYTIIKKIGKVEPLRWYYHCDRLGMPVLQECLEGGEASETEHRKIKKTLYNTVSVIKWVGLSVNSDF